MGKLSKIVTLQIVATSLHIFWCYVFIDFYDLKLQGVALAVIITNFTLFVFTILIIFFDEEAY